MKIILAEPRGFCAGVNMAIESLERALELFGTPLYVFHEIVHNQTVVRRFRHRGVLFVNDLAEVPPGATVIYSAHGVSPMVRNVAHQRNLRVIDATCPLVAKVHREVERYSRQGYLILLIGHAGHDEIVGTLGIAPHNTMLIQSLDDIARLELPSDAKVAYLTQTTLSVDETINMVSALRQRFPQIVGPAHEDICYATQNRQDAVRQIMQEADVVLVFGSHNSSNSWRLVELARNAGKPAFLLDDVGQLDEQWLTNVETVLITAGASAPEDLVQECVAHLCERYGASVESRSVRTEFVTFPLPEPLRPEHLN